MSIQEITVDELAALLDAGRRLIDVREPDEYTDGHVPGAVSIPLGTVPDNVDAFRGDDVVLVICKGGGRSLRACEFLADAGVEAINVAGGTMAWAMGGRPTTAGDQPA